MESPLSAVKVTDPMFLRIPASVQTGSAVQVSPVLQSPLSRLPSLHSTVAVHLLRTLVEVETSVAHPDRAP